MTTKLSDKAIAVFAFAAYHQLNSGEQVREVVVDDEAGHKADPEALGELEQAGLLTVADKRATFTDSGHALFAKIVSGLRSDAA